jgi:hypothetical protein
MTRPPLTIVGAGSDTAPPPRPLGRHGRALWDGVVAENVFTDCAGREMLCSACEAVDRLEELAAEIARDGPVIRTKTSIREHPALKAELANRSFVVRTLARLGLDAEPLRAIGRPPTKYFPMA